MNPLLASAHNWSVLKADLRERYPDLSDDDFVDTLEGEFSLQERIERVLDSREQDLAYAAVLKAQIADMQERMQRFQRRAETKKELVGDAMEEAAIDKLEFARFTVSRRWQKGSVVITDESALPDDCIRVKQEPDKTAIAAFLKAGLEVPGATFGNDYRLTTVRTK